MGFGEEGWAGASGEMLGAGGAVNAEMGGVPCMFEVEFALRDWSCLDHGASYVALDSLCRSKFHCESRQ